MRRNCTAKSLLCRSRRRRAPMCRHISASVARSKARRINGAFAQLDWTPIRYLNRKSERNVLMALFRAAHVGYVTPLRDGMNLVAKEYVAAQAPHDPGV